MRDWSQAFDRALGGALEPPRLSPPGPGPSVAGALPAGQSGGQVERTRAERAGAAVDALRASERAASAERRSGWVYLAALGVPTGLAGVLAWGARRRRRPGIMVAFAFAGLAVAAAGLAVAGRVASRTSDAGSARRTVEEYAAAPVMRAEDARWFAGTAGIVGRPAEVVHPHGEFLYFRGPGRSTSVAQPMPDGTESDGGRGAPYDGFRLGLIEVAPSPPERMRVVRPHVRLGWDGRETFIAGDEEVIVFGFLVDGKVSARAERPVVLAPAAASRVRETMADDLLGRAATRARHLACLHVVFGAWVAWFLALLAASATEAACLRADTRRQALARPSAQGNEKGLVASP